MSTLSSVLDRLAFRLKTGWPSPPRAPGVGRGPDFLGIGAQKAGTTWLHECLRRHPEVYLPPEKELHYFDERQYRSFRSYASRFRPAGPRLRGEITPAYGILPAHRVALVHRLLPDLKLILLLRDPVQRSWSQALMELADLPGRSPESISVDEWIRFLGSPACRARSDYESMLARWTAHFGEDRMFVGFHDHVASRPRDLLSDIFDFLGVAPPADWSAYPTEARVQPAGVRGGRYEPRPPMPSPGRDWLVSTWSGPIARLALRFPDPVSSWGA